jgi:competence protein ComEC
MRMGFSFIVTPTFMKHLKNTILITILLLPALAFSQAGQNMKVHIINVGQGSSALIEFPCGVILIDAGAESNAEFNGRQMLSDYLANFFQKRADLNNTISLLLITHPHKDHTSGVKDVIANYHVKNVVTNGQEYGSGSSQQKFLHQFVAETESTDDTSDDVGYFESMAGGISSSGKTNAIIDPVACNGIDPIIKVLWGRVSSPSTTWSAGAFDNNNNHSVVTRVDFGQSSILFTGDLEDVAVADLVKKYRNTSALDVDIYVAGHHGSKNGTTTELIKAISPEMAVLSCGDPERQRAWTAWKYGHPNKGVVKMLSDNCTRNRFAKEVLVGNGSTKFEYLTISKAVYATGWDGNVLLQGSSDGKWINVDEDISGIVNINTATLEELMTLPNIGTDRASAIVAYRQQNGTFATIEDLDNVSGIGPATIVRLKTRVRV